MKRQPGLRTSPPVFGEPTLRQVHRFTAEPLVTGSPLFGEPGCGPGVEAKPTADLVTGAPVFGEPTLRQVHKLTANVDDASVQQTAAALKEKAAKADRRREIIRTQALALWAEKPALAGAGMKTATAKKIMPAVRADLLHGDKCKTGADAQLTALIRKNLPEISR